MRVIVAFKDREAEKIFDGARSRRYAGIQKAIERKLRMLHRATSVDDLKEPPGNRLEKLQGDRSGQYSIRVNDQFRICFEWESGNAENVEVADCH